MRILFIPLGTATHYLPMVPLAWACRSAGHEVRIASQPEAVDAIVRSGMVAAPVGQGYDFIEGFIRNQADVAGYLRRKLGGEEPARDSVAKLSPGEQAELKSLRLEPSVRAAEMIVDDLVALGRDWRPDLVVADPLVLAAPLLSQHLGVPVVHHLFGLAVQRHVGFPANGAAEGQWTDELRDLYGRFGVEIRDEYAVATVDPCPASLQFPGIPDRIAMRYVPYNGPGVSPDWLYRPGERPRVCVTWGTSIARIVGVERLIVPEVLEALSGLDVETVVAAHESDRALPSKRPGNVRVVEGLPLHVLLPTCAAIIHPGAAGTMLTAACHGVPQVTGGRAMDQPFNSARLADTGAGVPLDLSVADADHVKQAAVRALSEKSVAAAAQRLSQEISEHPTPARVVGILEEMV